jgi:hypothetical protein
MRSLLNFRFQLGVAQAWLFRKNALHILKERNFYIVDVQHIAFESAEKSV